jgi:diguanylate cyclase (GGDEF)-like protein/PAS domain S-box-containing protein
MISKKTLLEDLENRDKVLFCEAPDAYYINDLNGVFLDGNKAAERLTGYKKEELIGKNFLNLKLLSLNQIPKAVKLLKLNKKGLPTGPDEFVLSTREGNILNVEISTYPTEISGKKVVLGIARDISRHIELERKIQNINQELEENVIKRTAELASLNLQLEQELDRRKSIEKDLIDSRNQYLNLFDNAPEGIIILNKSGIISGCNKTVYDFSGYLPIELINKNFTKVCGISPKDIPELLKKFSKAIVGRKTGVFKVCLKRKDGQIFYGEVRVGRIKENNRVTGLQVMIRDITQKIKDEKALSESEKRFQLLSEATSEGILIHDKGKFIDANNKLIEMFGMTREEGQKKTVFNFLDKSCVAKVLKNIMINYDKPYDALGIKKDGTRFPIKVCAKAMNYNGKMVHVATITDISGEVYAKNAFTDSENRFKLFSEATSDGVLLHEKGRIIDGNEKLADMFGITREEGIGQSILKYLVPKYRPIAIKNILIKYRKPYEVMAFRKDKTMFPIEICARTIPLNGKNVRVASVRDITKYKEAEKVIKESEQQFRNMAEMLPETLFEADKSGKITYLNKAGRTLIGYDIKDLDKGLKATEVIDEIDHIRLKKDMEFLFKNKSMDPQQYLAKKKDGQKIFAELHSSVKINEKGETVGIRGILIDITERKKTEEKIKYLSFHDYLTGIYNRAFFEEELHRLDTERQLPITLVIGDVNGLKIINDAFGHEKGDELLIKVAKILKESFRSEDIVSRCGGDEFNIVLPNSNLQDTLKIVERINRKLKAESTQLLPLSVAFGLATKEDNSQEIDGLIKIAEDRMYRHKMMNQQSTHSRIISSLGKALEERDYETAEHVKRMKSMATDLGAAINLPEEILDEVALLAALHDIGKISIADDIIFKPGSLTQEEWQIMKRHPEIGYHIAESSVDLIPIAKGILYHHEWWNGKGYPKGIEGENIPLIARIVSIIDAYDAMTNDRPYRKALSVEEAIEELKRCAGSQFDPNLTEKFVGIIEKTKNRNDYIHV